MSQVKSLPRGMPARMRRSALVGWLVLAACGGGQTPPGGGGEVAPEVAPEDPALAFRNSYQNPGGMWMPAQMTLPQHVDNFRRMGVALDAAALADPLKAPLAAVVSLGGCTGSFVSPDGLIVTNHHCVRSILQYVSDATHDHIEDGFLARTRADERSGGPARRVMVVQSYRDVTAEMRGGLDAIADPVARKLESEKRLKALLAGCEKDRPGTRCQVSSFFQGGHYQLIEMLEIRDVRLVYAPARAVGEFGGEIDNWEWPRHTGDWSFLRAYVGADGRPAEYSPENVPYRSPHWLKVSTAGLDAGDFVMVTGFPGRTARTVPAAELHHNLDWHHANMIGYLEKAIGRTGLLAVRPILRRSSRDLWQIYKLAEAGGRG